MSSIFLSHNHKDRIFAKKLGEELMKQGIRTWIDEAEMQVGDSLISKIESAIRKFTYLGVILSPNSVKSDWVIKEVNIALTEEIKGRKVKVLPLLYKKCKIPVFLVDKLYADFTENFEKGFEKLLCRLKSDKKENDSTAEKALDVIVKIWEDNGTFVDFQTIDLILKRPPPNINQKQAKILVATSLHHRERFIEKNLDTGAKWTDDIDRVIECLQFVKNGGIEDVYVLLIEILFQSKEWHDQVQVGRFIQHALFGKTGDPGQNMFTSEADVSKLLEGFTIEPSDYMAPLVDRRLVPHGNELKIVAERCQELVKSISNSNYEV